MHGSRRCVSLALALALCACGAIDRPLARVECRDLDAGYAVSYQGDDALVACVHDPRMQREGHRREARLGPGRFDFGDGERLELDSGWTIAGAGPDATTLFASRPTTHVFQDDIHSALFVHGARVRLAGFRFDGRCRDGPSPGPECPPDPADTLLAIVVACGYGFERGPDCDVDGLVVEDVRVVGVKTPFVATASEPRPAASEKGLFANFRDFSWTIRRFQVSDRDDTFRFARVFEVGNAATAEMSQGPGVGVSAPRRYVVNLEDLDIDTHVGKGGGQLAGLLTMAINAPVSLEVNLRRSRLVATERVVGIATHAVARDGADRGSALLRCEESQLVADLRDWGSRVREPGSRPCPPFDAALYLGEFSRPGGSHRARAELRGCEVRTLGFLALCPAPASIDLGAPALAPHTSACIHESRVEPATRGAGRVETGDCASEAAAP